MRAYVYLVLTSQVQARSGTVGNSVGTGIYMLPSNLNLSMGKTKGYNNKNLVSNADMKIGSNRDTNKDHKKLPVTHQTMICLK